ncbi:hypothetical protein CERSUDRAFT_100375 [Gelatoporia subvermispora B]|uniref:C2H2-type domain-containing protein n=1 Tax=Ceriporiopsis subvermispora (strain B) TaxID=914234 RepID=M2Q404_CERS8|nr:hypothetical protein CERSUDRAFT_100375 [Gelatoporia subvermispora B]
MNWLEPIEFTPCSPWPLDSYLHVSRSPSPSPPPPDSDPLFAPDSSLEQELCSNFSCCGLALHDLHSLLEHFEESHVVVLGADGRPLYPSPSPSPSSAFAHSSTSHPPPSPHASLALNYPHPGPPAPAPADSLLAPALQYAQAASTFRDLTRLARFPPDASPMSASARSDDSFPALGESICLPPALLTVAPPAPPPALPQIDTQVARAPGMDSPVSALDSAESDTAERVKAKARRGDKGRNRAERVELVHREGRERKERQRTAGGRRRDREKTFVCPRPGCTKAYLNPNGLKYHLEKGTCTVVLDSPSSGCRNAKFNRTVLFADIWHAEIWLPPHGPSWTRPLQTPSAPLPPRAARCAHAPPHVKQHPRRSSPTTPRVTCTSCPGTPPAPSSCHTAPKGQSHLPYGREPARAARIASHRARSAPPLLAPVVSATWPSTGARWHGPVHPCPHFSSSTPAPTSTSATRPRVSIYLSPLPRPALFLPHAPFRQSAARLGACDPPVGASAPGARPSAREKAATGNSRARPSLYGILSDLVRPPVALRENPGLRAWHERMLAVANVHATDRQGEQMTAIRCPVGTPGVPPPRIRASLHGLMSRSWPKYDGVAPQNLDVRFDSRHAGVLEGAAPRGLGTCSARVARPGTSSRSNRAARSQMRQGDAGPAGCREHVTAEVTGA